MLVAAVLLVGCEKPSNPQADKAFNPQADKALFNAVEKGDLRAAKNAIINGANLNAKNNWLRTPLHVVTGGDSAWVKHKEIPNRKEITELLISKGADVNARDQNRQTPLIGAAKLGYEGICKLLISKGANVNALANPVSFFVWNNGNKNINSALNQAICGDFASIVDMLISNGANTTYGSLCLAANGNSIKVSKLLVSKGKKYMNQRDKSGRTPLHIAANLGHDEILSILISSGANLNATEEAIPLNASQMTFNAMGVTPLHHAVDQYRVNSVKLLVSAGAQINPKTLTGKTPFDRAIKNGFYKIANYLREQNAKSSETNVVQLAIINSDIEKLKNVLKKDKVDGSGTDICPHPLHHAVFWGEDKIVELLINSGVDPSDEKIFGKGKPLLNISTKYNHHETSKILILNGVSVNQKDVNGFTPLHFASSSSFEITKLLINRGADVNAKNIYKRTPLYYAAGNGMYEVVSLLISKSKNLNNIDGYGLTPLHIAAKGHKKITLTLIENGSDVNTKDKNGNTPLDIAAENQNTEIAALLRKHGGKTGKELKAAGN